MLPETVFCACAEVPNERRAKVAPSATIEEIMFFIVEICSEQGGQGRANPKLADHAAG